MTVITETCNSQNTLVLRAYKTYPLRERLALELDRKTREQFSRIRLGFFVNKRTDIKLVVARGSCLKISTKLHGNVFMGKKKVQFPQQKPVSVNVLRKVTCYSFYCDVD